MRLFCCALLASALMASACGKRGGANPHPSPQASPGDSNSSVQKEFIYLSPVGNGPLWGIAPWVSYPDASWRVGDVRWAMHVRPGEEAAADDLVGFWESSYRGWLKGLVTDGARVAPRPFRVTFEDRTGGVRGYEKFISIKNQTIEGFSPLAKRWKERCPILFAEGSFLREVPLHFVWTQQNTSEVDTLTRGYYESAFSIRAIGQPVWNVERKEGAGVTKTPVLFGAEAYSVTPTIAVIGEEYLPPDATESMKRSQIREGNQASWEQCGAPVYAWESNCEKAPPRAIDTVLSHEFGHHVFSAWAATHGRHAVESKLFSENIAEIFMMTCYGALNESPRWLRERADKYTDTNYWQKSPLTAHPYSPEPFGGSTELFPWLKSRGLLDTNKIMGAILRAWEKMDGSYEHRVYCNPQGLGRCPWGEYREGPIASQIPTLEWTQGEPKVWTWVEFLERFIDVYDFETPELRAGFEKSLRAHKEAATSTEDSYGWEY